MINVSWEDVADRLRDWVDSLVEQLRAKDERIAKLDAVRVAAEKLMHKQHYGSDLDHNVYAQALDAALAAVLKGETDDN